MAIITASKKIGAYVEVIGKARDSKHGAGQYRPVLFHRNDKVGDEQKVWKSMNLQDAEQLSKGQFVHLIPTQRDGKDIWDIEILADTQTPTPQASQPTPPVATTAPPNPAAMIAGQSKKAIAQYIGDMGDLYVHCYSVATQKLPECVGDAQVQAMASSLFIAAQRKFGLA